jgi:hypothetical protein
MLRLMAAVCYNLKRLLKWMGENIENLEKHWQNSFYAVDPRRAAQLETPSAGRCGKFK